MASSVELCSDRMVVLFEWHFLQNIAAYNPDNNGYFGFDAWPVVSINGAFHNGTRYEIFCFVRWCCANVDGCLLLHCGWNACVFLLQNCTFWSPNSYHRDPAVEPMRYLDVYYVDFIDVVAFRNWKFSVCLQALREELQQHKVRMGLTHVAYHMFFDIVVLFFRFLVIYVIV